MGSVQSKYCSMISNVLECIASIPEPKGGAIQVKNNISVIALSTQALGAFINLLSLC